jgi:hypothetical protein
MTFTELGSLCPDSPAWAAFRAAVALERHMQRREKNQPILDRMVQDLCEARRSWWEYTRCAGTGAGPKSAPALSQALEETLTKARLYRRVTVETV